MSTDVTVLSIEACPTAVVAATTTWSDLPSQWKPMLDRVWVFLASAPEGLYDGGHNVMLYRDDVPNVEVGVQVTRTFEPVGDVVPSELPSGPAARATHRGPIHDIAKSHDAVRRWSVENGYRVLGPHWEVYGDPDPGTGDFAVEVFWSVERSST